MSLPAPLHPAGVIKSLRRGLRPCVAIIAAGLLALAAPLPLLAQPPATTSAAAVAPANIAPAAASSAFGELMGIVLPLVLIIVALLAVLYLVRRRFGLTGQDAPLSIVQILPLGPRERLVLIRSRSGRIFTVGVAAQGVSLVTHLDPADIVALAEDHETAAMDTAAAGETAVRPAKWRRIFLR